MVRKQNNFALKKIDPESPCIISLNAYKRIVIYASRYANIDMKSKDWREAYGILIGYIKNDDTCYIKDAIPMISGGRAGVRFETKQYVDMAQIDEELYEKYISNQSEDFIIGWWHTHPGFGFFFSETDILTHLGYQGPNPYAIGIVYDHTEQNDNFPGIKGLRLDDPSRDMHSKYVSTELKFEEPVEEIIKKTRNITKKILPRFKEVKQTLQYIHNILRKKLMAQLQRNFGLILVPRRSKKITDSEELANEDEDKYLYEWDPKLLEKKYRVPHFREKFEGEIIKSKRKLKKILQDKTTVKSEVKKKFEETTKKIQSELTKKLMKPKDWLEKIKIKFNEKLEIINPYFDYLDTAERKIVEYLDNRLSSYSKELEIIEKKLKFKMK